MRIGAIRCCRVLRLIVRRKCAAFCAAFTYAGRKVEVGIAGLEVMPSRHQRGMPQPAGDVHGHDEKISLGTFTTGEMQVQLAHGHGAAQAGKQSYLVVKLSYSDQGQSSCARG